MIDSRKLILAALSTLIVALFIFFRFFLFASGSSLLGTFWLYVIVAFGAAFFLLGFFRESLLSFNNAEDKKSAAWIILLPVFTLIFYLTVIRLTHIDSALRLARYGIRNYESLSDIRDDFHGFARIRNGGIDAQTSVYYPGSEEDRPEIYYAIRDNTGGFLGVYIDSIFHLKHEFIDRVSADKREGRPISGFMAHYAGWEKDLCADALSDGRKQYGWPDIENALCLVYMPGDSDFIDTIRWRMRIMLPSILLSHFGLCLILMRKLR